MGTSERGGGAVGDPISDSYVRRSSGLGPVIGPIEKKAAKNTQGAEKIPKESNRVSSTPAHRRAGVKGFLPSLCRIPNSSASTRYIKKRERIGGGSRERAADRTKEGVALSQCQDKSNL